MSVMNSAYLRTIPVMGPALREQQSAETPCASAVLMTLTVVSITPATLEIAMANASQVGRHATRPVSLDTIFASTQKAVNLNTVLKDA